MLRQKTFIKMKNTSKQPLPADEMVPYDDGGDLPVVKLIFPRMSNDIKF